MEQTQSIFTIITLVYGDLTRLHKRQLHRRQLHIRIYNQGKEVWHNLSDLGKM